MSGGLRTPRPIPRHRLAYAIKRLEFRPDHPTHYPDIQRRLAYIGPLAFR